MTTSEEVKLKKINEDSCKKLAQRFFKRKQEVAKINKDFENLKECFYSNMQEYYELNNVSRVKTRFKRADGNALLITRAQRISVEFDADAVEKVLGKTHSKKVVEKSYAVNNMQGLIAYAKTLGADPIEFKKFFEVTKKVNQAELDQLEELGEIKQSQLEGCYTIKKGDPYFLVKEVEPEAVGDED